MSNVIRENKDPKKAEAILAARSRTSLVAMSRRL
jgi:hypothetical protein